MPSRYTYQGGHAIPLSAGPASFISRADPRRLIEQEFDIMHATSPHSWRVATTPDRLEAEMARARSLGRVFHDYMLAETNTAFLITDRILVRFRDAGVDVDAFAAKWRLEIVRRWSGRDFLFRTHAGDDPVEIVLGMTERDSDLVEVVDHDRNVPLRLTSPADAASQWYLHSSTSDPSIDGRALLHCDDAWRLLGSYGSPEIVIGVIDDGCDLEDPDFETGKFTAWGAFVDGDLLTSEMFPDSGPILMRSATRHGTVCAAFAAADINGRGGVGVAAGSKLLPVKLDDTFLALSTATSRMLDLIAYVRSRVDVVSCSWSHDPPRYWPPIVCEQLAEAAVNGGRNGKGVLWVLSAGNDNVPVHGVTSRAVPWFVGGHGPTMQFEARTDFTNSFVGIPGVIHVGAISSRAQRCHYSNYGDGLDVVAPSSNSHCYGRAVVGGASVRAPLRSVDMVDIGGTSTSTPLVAGVAALVRSANPNLTARDTASILRRTADKDLLFDGYARSHFPDDVPTDWDISPVPPHDAAAFIDTGHPDGTWSPWFGFGKVNARRAVEAALATLGRS
jgi:subtilisin family serine protease